MIIRTLLTIKTLRLERSKQALDQQMLKVQAAHHACQQSIEEHRAFREWRIGEEICLFDECKATVLDQRALEQWQQKVALLRKQEGQREEVIAEKQAQLDREREQYKMCQQQYRSAQQQTEKFEELNRHALAEEKLLLEFKEEQELEEFRRMETIS